MKRFASLTVLLISFIFLTGCTKVSPLEGYWERDTGMVIHITGVGSNYGGDGKFIKIGSGIWADVDRQLGVARGNKLTKIKVTGENSWKCQDLWQSTHGDGKYTTYWNSSTIEMIEDGKIRVTGYDSNTGKEKPYEYKKISKADAAKGRIAQ